ncbi:MAG: sulfurtransferase, partial [Sneathiella sp.]
MSYTLISPSQVRAVSVLDQEYAFLDMREQGVHSEGHPFFSVPLPLSRLELDIERLVPRKTVPLLLLDQGPELPLAQRAADILAGFGYTDIRLVDGGVQGWRDAGYELFSGVNVPSKAFGEFVEEAYETPHISAVALDEKVKNGEKIVILDSRPFPEFHRMSIPGGIDMPGAELVHRVFETIPDEETHIVVNCAGRTRSIIGAQSLINAGVPNKVSALKDGTMGWYLADLTLAYREDTVASPPGALAGQKSREAAHGHFLRSRHKFHYPQSAAHWFWLAEDQ